MHVPDSSVKLFFFFRNAFPFQTPFILYRVQRSLSRPFLFYVTPCTYRVGKQCQAESVGRTDFRTIEHLLRVGNKKLKVLGMPGVRRAAGMTVERR